MMLNEANQFFDASEILDFLFCFLVPKVRYFKNEKA
jgi:hypothetical protein